MLFKKETFWQSLQKEKVPAYFLTKHFSVFINVEFNLKKEGFSVERQLIWISEQDCDDAGSPKRKGKKMEIEIEIWIYEWFLILGCDVWACIWTHVSRFF